MYCDKDNQSRYSIMDLDKEELETIRRALTAYRVGMVQNDILPGHTGNSEIRKQYDRAGVIVQHIEVTL